MRIATGGRAVAPRPLLYLMLAAALWGAAVSATKFALHGFDPLALLTVELMAATITLWAALLATGYRPPASLRVAVLLGLLEPALAYLGDTVGLSRTDAVDGSIISGLEAGLVVVLAALLLGEGITAGAVVAVGLGLAGLVVIAGQGGSASAIGDLYVAGGVLSASLYTIVAKRFDDGSDPLSLTTWQFTSATAAALTVCGLRSVATGATPAMSAAPQYWLAAVAVGAVGLAGAFLLYNSVLSHVDASWTAIVLNLIPVFGILSAIGVLGEHLNAPSALGSLLIGASVVCLTIFDVRGINGIAPVPGQVQPASSAAEVGGN